MTGRGDREPLLSPDARQFGAARDGRSAPFLISGPAPLLGAPSVRARRAWGPSGRLRPRARPALAPDTSCDSGAGPVAPGPPGARRREARAQRLRQPGGTACHLLSPSGPDNLTALGLRRDQLLERIAVAVTVDAGLEVRGHRADQRCGRPELTGCNVDVLAEERKLGYAHLIGAERGLNHEDAVAQATRHEALTLTARHM